MRITPRVAALAGSLALAGCSPAPSRPEAPLVRVVTVGSAEGRPIAYTGVVRARIESDLGFRVGGKIVERLVDPGQRVRAGQPLMRLDPTDVQLAASAAADRVRAARAEAERASAEERRLSRLLAAGAVSRSAYDAALAASQSASANLSAATSLAREAENQRDYATLVADADGVVEAVQAQPGQVISAGAPVIRLGRAGALEAAVAVPETQVRDLPKTGRARIYGESGAVPARLREVAGAADPLTRTFDARYTLSAANLPLGATVTLELPRPTSAQVAVPLAALHDGGGGPGVWVVTQDNRVRFRGVRISVLGEETAALLPGALASGDRVVALGAHLLREGQAVRVATSRSAAQ